MIGARVGGGVGVGVNVGLGEGVSAGVTGGVGVGLISGGRKTPVDAVINPRARRIAPDIPRIFGDFGSIVVAMVPLIFLTIAINRNISPAITNIVGISDMPKTIFSLPFSLPDLYTLVIRV